MKKYGKVIMVAIFAIVLAVIFVFLYLKSRPEEIRYEKVRPEIRTIEKTAVVTGKIVPRDEINIKPQISGIITESSRRPEKWSGPGKSSPRSRS